MQMQRIYTCTLALLLAASPCALLAQRGTQGGQDTGARTGTQPSTHSDWPTSSQRDDTQGTQQPGAMSRPTQGSTSTKLSMSDRRFLTKAAEGGMAEVEMGNIAKQHASNDAVKQFGDQMVTDHSKANEELKSLQSQKGETPPANLSMKDKRSKDRLSKLSGQEFDKEYMKNMVADHEKDVAEFRKASQNAKDADVKAFAAKTLPILEQHLQKARSIASQVGAK